MAAPGQLIPIYDPTTGQQFQYNGRLNVIPPSRISANSAILIPFIPNPDRPGSGVGGLDSNKSYAPFINPHIQHVWGFTIDQKMKAKQSVHYSQWRNSFSNWSFDTNRIWSLLPIRSTAEVRTGAGQRLYADLRQHASLRISS